MAYGSMSNDELYGDGGGSEGQSEHSAEPKEDLGEQSAVIPKSLCPGMEPGSVIELKIEEVRGDSYVVTYEKGEEKESEQPQAPAEMAQEGGGSPMSAMMD